MHGTCTRRYADHHSIEMSLTLQGLTQFQEWIENLLVGDAQGRLRDVVKHANTKGRSTTRESGEYAKKDALLHWSEYGPKSGTTTFEGPHFLQLRLQNESTNFHDFLAHFNGVLFRTHQSVDSKFMKIYQTNSYYRATVNTCALHCFNEC